MDFIILIKALILGIVEGLTEFLPVSSTGHLIVVGDLIHFNSDIAHSFEIVIQLGAILAICWEYRKKIGTVIHTLPTNISSRKLIYNLIWAFLPAAILGFLFIKPIKYYLFNPFSVACALIIGGLIILWIEKRPQKNQITILEEITARDAFKIGLAQCIALIPGASRSGATIMGAILFGVERKVATEFSFFLAIPVIFAATIYDVYKHWSLFTLSDLPVFIVGCIAAFFSAFIAVKALLRFITTHTFIVFAWYRIIFGIVILAFLYN